MTTILVYPVSLFEINLIVKNNKDSDIYIIEDPTYFTNFKFHKMKLVLHRATMKFYQDYLTSDYPKQKIKYIEHNETNTFYTKTLKKYKKIIMHDVTDHVLTDYISTLAKKYSTELEIVETPLFIETVEDLKEYNKNIKKNHYVHDASFYRWQRRKLNVLMKDNKPLYDKWSFDRENREPFDENYDEPKNPKINSNKYVSDAKKYVSKYFNDNFGETENFIYPVTFKEAKKLLSDFIKNKLSTFGKYEDAVSKDITFGSHSILSSSLNIGIITPRYVLDEVMNHFEEMTSAEKKSNINNIEAFVRQLIGWRSFTRCLYLFHGKEMIKMNKLNHKYKLNAKWYDAETGITPVDFMIEKVRKYAYLHHIERLMYVGNFSLLTQVDPKEIYNCNKFRFIITPTVSTSLYIYIKNL
jgi:deoxyribodipyrimidine photolyase-related protein